ncbi:MAG: DUF418 domain-containing protein [Gemmatimonadetes bacterium]|nr:DUF418 domain-containing protein [Gemmatimonadota bacterium]
MSEPEPSPDSFDVPPAVIEGQTHSLSSEPPGKISGRLVPTTPTERIQVLDVLRGVALLGILITNIQHFSMFAGTVRNPTLYGDLTGANLWVYSLTFNLAFQKFMPIFSMLFGAGIMMAATRREAAGERAGIFHYRRMFFLLLIALAHSYLIWYGDILFVYAVCGALVFPLRFRSARFLIAAGIVMLAGQPIMEIITFRMTWIYELVNPFAGMSLEEVSATDLAAFQGGWMENFRQRAAYSLEGQTVGFLLHGIWRGCGLILLGMGLYRLRILTGERARSFYRTLIAVGLGIGIPITAFAFWMSYSANWGDFWVQQFALQVIHWVGIVVSLAWIGIVMLACRPACRSWMGRALAAVGRTALSNYLLHSLICTFIFYGFGLGLYGSVERTEQIGIVFAVWVLQLLISPLWLRYFRFGPAEWLWRSLSYGGLQPFRVGRPRGSLGSV